MKRLYLLLLPLLLFFVGFSYPASSLQKSVLKTQLSITQADGAIGQAAFLISQQQHDPLFFDLGEMEVEDETPSSLPKKTTTALGTIFHPSISRQFDNTFLYRLQMAAKITAAPSPLYILIRVIKV